MENQNQKSFLDKMIEKIDFLGNVTCENVSIEKDNKIKEEEKKDKKEDYISQNIYIISPN